MSISKEELSEMAKYKVAKVCELAAGLLASGHYTNQDDDNREGDPYVRTWDAGKDWLKDGYVRRFCSHAVTDAVNLFEEIESQIEKDEA
jgi:hypothetical protein